MTIKKNNLIATLLLLIVFVSNGSANDNDSDFQKCFTSMQFYCDKGAGISAIHCARKALLSWKYSNIPEQKYPPESFMQEYHNALFEKLIIDDVSTPPEFCHNKGPAHRLLCLDELNSYLTPEVRSRKVRRKRNGKVQEMVITKRCRKEEQRKHAVRYAFFYAVWRNGKKESDTLNPARLDSLEDEYIYEMHLQIEIMRDMVSPELFCRNKFQPDHENPVL